MLSLACEKNHKFACDPSGWSLAFGQLRLADANSNAYKD